MRVKKFRDFEEAAAKPSPGQVFLIAGTEYYQADRLLRTVVKGYVDGLGYELVRLSPEEMSDGDIHRHLSSPPLFASGTLVQISNVNKLTRRMKDELLTAAGDLSGNAILCRTDQTRLTAGFLGKLEKIAVTYVCWEPFQRDMFGWGRRLASENGVNLSGNGMHIVEFYASGKLERLADAMERLAIFYGTGTAVDRDDVIRVLTGRADQSVFDLSDHLFSNNRARTLDAMKSLLTAGEEPVRILAFLFNQWLMVNRARDILSAGGSTRDVSGELGIRYMQLDRIVAAAGKTCITDPSAAAEAFAEADRALKTGGDSFTVLVGIIFTLTSSRS